jgi:hypothetical protein
MPTKNNEHSIQAIGHWREGRPIEAGRLIFENIAPEVRPKWASSILASVVERTGVHSPPIENILQIASHRDEWKKAHEAFSSARDLTLELERIGDSRSVEQTLLLRMVILAELVAKVTYNATSPPDEFDEDSGWWIAVCLKGILDFLGDDDFSSAMWLALSFGKTQGR